MYSPTINLKDINERKGIPWSAAIFSYMDLEIRAYHASIFS